MNLTRFLFPWLPQISRVDSQHEPHPAPAEVEENVVAAADRPWLLTTPAVVECFEEATIDRAPLCLVPEPSTLFKSEAPVTPTTSTPSNRCLGARFWQGAAGDLLQHGLRSRTNICSGSADKGTREPEETVRTHLGVGFGELFLSSNMEYVALSAEDLVQACSQTGDSAAWEEFVRRFHRLIATVSLRTARRCGETSPHVIDELVQETYVKLCSDNFRLLRSFQPRHPDAFYGFLKVVTANLVLDHFKATRSEKRGSGTAEVANESPVNADSDTCGAAATAESSERRILLKELDALLRKLAKGPHMGRDRRIFWLYYRAGLTAKAIASLPSIGLTTKGVESTILRLTRLLRREMLGGRSRQGEGQT